MYATPFRSILVLPPTDETIELDASYTYLSTISKPLGERGFYVFPVAIVDAYMKENGFSDPYEMHKIPLDKLLKVFGADTVLKVNIKSFGQKYLLLVSNTEVHAEAELIDLRTGEKLWQGTSYASEGSSNGGGGLAGMMVSALVDQVVDSLSFRVRDIAVTANWQMIHSSKGLPLGPYKALEAENHYTNVH